MKMIPAGTIQEVDNQMSSKYVKLTLPRMGGSPSKEMHSREDTAAAASAPLSNRMKNGF